MAGCRSQPSMASSIANDNNHPTTIRLRKSKLCGGEHVTLLITNVENRHTHKNAQKQAHCVFENALYLSITATRVQTMKGEERSNKSSGILCCYEHVTAVEE